MNLCYWQGERSHRSVNRDGVGLTLLGAAMRGWHYDRRAFVGLDLSASLGVHSRDQQATYAFRSQRSITRHVNVQRRTAKRLPRNEEEATPDTVAPPMTTLPVGSPDDGSGSQHIELYENTYEYSSSDPPAFEMAYKPHQAVPNDNYPSVELSHAVDEEMSSLRDERISNRYEPSEPVLFFSNLRPFSSPLVFQLP
ncbi:hypothetical protein CPC08DRAFT_714688 [Agrocybe pediades]|nr:hypothetical protein CPC08DRAFT_714688 [Agrocybe pediades]